MNWCSFGLHRWTKWEDTKQTYKKYMGTGLYNIVSIFKRTCVVCEIDNYKSVDVKENLFS